MWDIPITNEIANGTYKGILEKVEEMPSKNPAFPGNFRKWWFLIDVAGVTTSVTATSSLNNGPKAKSYQWLKALLRRELRAGERVEDPTGKAVMVVLETNEKGYPVVVDLLPIADAPEQVLAGVPR